MVIFCFLAPFSTEVLLGLEPSRGEIGRDQLTCSPSITADEMGLAGSTLQRAASEIIRFPSAAKTDGNNKNEEHGTGIRSDHQRTLLEAPVEGATPLEGSAGVKGSCGTLDQCETDGKDESGSNDESTPKMSERHGGLSRSLADRIESPEFTPFGGSTVREQPALVPVPVETVTPTVPFDADFMMRGTTRAATHDESSENFRTSTLEAPFMRKACDNCTRRKKACDGNISCARCVKSNEKCNRSALKIKRHDAPRSVAPPAVTGRGNSQQSGSLNEEVSSTGNRVPTTRETFGDRGTAVPGV